MRKSRRNARTVKAEAGTDYGPAYRLRHDGRLEAWKGAAAVDIVERDDPEVTERRRLVRGARRRNVLIDLEARRIITKRMLHAAERFLDDCSIASGATSTDAVGMPSILGPRAGLPERQVNAIFRVNTVRRLLGLNNGTVFWWVAFENGSLADYETRHKLRNGAATQLLRDALSALDEHYHHRTTSEVY